MKVGRHRLLIAEIGVIILFATGLLSTMSFLSSVTPKEAIYLEGRAMPAEWEAGVAIRGMYCKWFTIAKHPLLFVFSISILAGSGFALWLIQNYDGQFPADVTIKGKRQFFIIASLGAGIAVFDCLLLPLPTKMGFFATTPPAWGPISLAGSIALAALSTKILSKWLK